MDYSMEAAASLVGWARAYALVGVAVAGFFLLGGIERVSESARGAYLFRPLLIPGVVLIWPLVLWRWAVLAMGRDDWRGRHAPPRKTPGAIWAVMGVLIPLIFFGALVARQNGPLERPAVQLAPPAPAESR